LLLSNFWNLCAGDEDEEEEEDDGSGGQRVQCG